MAELTLSAEIAPCDPGAISAWLARHHITGPDADALRGEFARLQLYRTLVQRNLRGALRATIPRTVARLGSQFERYFSEFLQAEPPVTRYLRDLTPSFLRFALPRWSSDSAVPAYLADLAHHEALQVELASLRARPKHHVPATLALDEGVEFIDAARLVEYAWAVQRLPDDETSTDLPEQAACSLLVYRSPEHDVRYLELGAFARELLSGLLNQRRTLRVALTSAAERMEQPLDDALLTRAARLLSELAERGALLGKSHSNSGHPPLSL